MDRLIIRFPEWKCKAVTLSYDDGRAEGKPYKVPAGKKIKL